jgi:ubiquinone/menaquinone biosynthesis C-methylase UbiE
MLNHQDVIHNIENFYDNQGWSIDQNKITTDAHLNEDLRTVAENYVSKCRLRLLNYLPAKGINILDMASGPIQYREYLSYSQNFKKRHCVDLSQKALAQAKNKITDHGEYYCGDFLSLRFENNYFDSAISCHTIYHIHKDSQVNAVDKILKVTKEGAPILIIYSNPNYCLQRGINFIKKIIKKKTVGNKNPVYFYTHPLSFWDQFADKAEIKIYPWRSMSAKHQKILFPDNIIGRKMFSFLFYLEELFPSFFIRHFKFYTVVLRKRRKT